jgi:hypothetical protein
MSSTEIDTNLSTSTDESIIHSIIQYCRSIQFTDASESTQNQIKSYVTNYHQLLHDEKISPTAINIMMKHMNIPSSQRLRGAKNKSTNIETLLQAVENQNFNDTENNQKATNQLENDSKREIVNIDDNSDDELTPIDQNISVPTTTNAQFSGSIQPNVPSVAITNNQWGAALNELIAMLPSIQQMIQERQAKPSNVSRPALPTDLTSVVNRIPAANTSTYNQDATLQLTSPSKKSLVRQLEHQLNARGIQVNNSELAASSANGFHGNSSVPIPVSVAGAHAISSNAGVNNINVHMPVPNSNTIPAPIQRYSSAVPLMYDPTIDPDEQIAAYDAYLSDRAKPIAGDVLTAAGGSLTAWLNKMNACDDTKIQSFRNRKELSVLALAIDRLVSEGIPVTSTGLETLVRRFVGVHTADGTGNWDIADVMDYDSRNTTLLPPSAVSWAVKQSKILKAMHGTGSSSTAVSKVGTQKKSNSSSYKSNYMKGINSTTSKPNPSSNSSGPKIVAGAHAGRVGSSTQ